MIYLITGLPGNGKTLITIADVDKRAKKESRPVFYNGITECTIDGWQEFTDPEKWHELPEGSIILIDECQRTFRPRPGRGGVPAHVEQLETHRHRGYDLYLITQHPTLIDNNVRRLAGTHRHLVRIFGTERAVIHEWGEVHLDCERNRKDSSKTTVAFPTEYYGKYKSAVIHTHKRQIPKQLYYLIACIVALALCLYLVISSISEASKPQGQAATSEEVPQFLLDSASSYGPEQKRPLTRDEYVASLTPRLENLQHTAPRYDDVTKPIEAPVIAGCVQMSGRCRCYSQRGTVLQSTTDQCQQILENGTPFYDFVTADGKPGKRQAPQREEPNA